MYKGGQGTRCRMSLSARIACTIYSRASKSSLARTQCTPAASAGSFYLSANRLAFAGERFRSDIHSGISTSSTPAAIVERLNQEINAIAASPDLAPVLEPDGTLPEAISPAPFAGRIKDELAQWKQIATEHKIVAE
jgi:hypothetical protein